MDVLTKFTDYPDDFLHGRLFMRSARSFRTEFEHEAGARHDPYELLHDKHQVENTRIKIEQGGKILYEGPASSETRLNCDNQIYLLCMSMFNFTNNSSDNNYQRQAFLGPEKNLGSYCILIKKPNEFINRIYEKIKISTYLFPYPSQEQIFGNVEYIDLKNHHGVVGPFRKSLQYAWQQEYRCVLLDNRDQKEPPDTFYFEIGSLLDITFVMETENFLTSDLRLDK